MQTRFLICHESPPRLDTPQATNKHASLDGVIGGSSIPPLLSVRRLDQAQGMGVVEPHRRPQIDTPRSDHRWGGAARRNLGSRPGSPQVVSTYYAVWGV